MIDLTPTEGLALEVLAARERLGEKVWTFEARHKRSLDSLAAKGLVDVFHGIVERTVRASLTDQGRAEAMSPDYKLPSQCETPTEKYRVAVIAFCEAEGVDLSDARSVAEIAMRRRTLEELHVDVPGRPGLRRQVVIHAVREVGVAQMNGYLNTTPTSKAYPREGA